jgi:hypothetical protein
MTSIVVFIYAFSLWVLTRYGVLDRPRTLLGAQALFFLPLLLSFSFFSGMTDAYRDLSRFGPVYAIRSTSFDTKVLLLRNLELGPLLRDPRTSSIHFVPWDDVKALSRVVTGPDPKTPLYRVVRDTL